MAALGKIMIVMMATTLASSAGCYAEPADSSWDYTGAQGADPTYAGDTDVEPPADYVATTQPVYFSGHGTYYYGRGWRYRDRGQWNTYRREPTTLRRYRVHGHASMPSGHRYEGSRNVAATHGGGNHGHR